MASEVTEMERPLTWEKVQLGEGPAAKVTQSFNFPNTYEQTFLLKAVQDDLQALASEMRARGGIQV